MNILEVNIYFLKLIEREISNVKRNLNGKKIYLSDVLFVLFVTLHVSFEYLSLKSFVGFQIGKKSALNMPYVA